MATNLTPGQQAGLSNATRNLQGGSIKNYRGIVGANSIKEKYDSWKQNNQGMQWFQYPPDLPEYYITLIGRDYSYGTAGATLPTLGQALGQQNTGKQGFVLPVPQMRLTDRYQVGYDDNFSYLGMLGLNGRGALEKGLASIGFSLNKFKSILIEAPIIKHHEFFWKLSPKMPSESQQIRTIVNQLKAGMAPPSFFENNIAENWAFKLPYIYHVSFYPNQAQMYGFKPCVIQSLDVDYGGQNPHPAFFKNGFPESIAITMSLIEVEVWVRSDYVEWNNNVTSGDSDPFNTIRQSNAENAIANIVNFGDARGQTDPRTNGIGTPKKRQ